MALVLLGCCFGFALMACSDGRYGLAVGLVIVPAVLVAVL